ncbi:ESX-1 secretion-associated protein EspB-like [Trichosurus vulpecula]|uniref:ESX-1 secretion-associated protein EspB-like n=1 Tax=Trichosurus vulpecula TaxID=9337 RepID=UPI00186B419B|nr:ESX-1 secretion-associated protein EspB-like [Trichosurus vulpecula]
MSPPKIPGGPPPCGLRPARPPGLGAGTAREATGRGGAGAGAGKGSGFGAAAAAAAFGRAMPPLSPAAAAAAGASAMEGAGSGAGGRGGGRGTGTRPRQITAPDSGGGDTAATARSPRGVQEGARPSGSGLRGSSLLPGAAEASPPAGHSRRVARLIPPPAAAAGLPPQPGEGADGYAVALPSETRAPPTPTSRYSSGPLLPPPPRTGARAGLERLLRSQLAGAPLLFLVRSYLPSQQPSPANRSLGRPNTPLPTRPLPTGPEGAHLQSTPGPFHQHPSGGHPVSSKEGTPSSPAPSLISKSQHWVTPMSHPAGFGC